MKKILGTAFLVTLLMLTIFALNKTDDTPAAARPVSSIATQSVSE